ncbi:oxygen-independent coproporphyrinogen-3 oxidase [Pseudobutyrivibrio sp. YE44]|uniref:radical SAM family heme chaperone HemW n=1 Tax=Pseudobutyrivibrio sp. YE44 TaxID=1520802 RepID=UPI00088F7960|nr:radical SAM family heme chaperone HemW [Pseudobutyrivibrio sp. YE44]SDB11800.1 oxygen-independent coproporphyrinogen-3 oxidase [Pseudobutyrivibrio sp. YE44]
MTGIEIYIHIPFCVKKCLYCDFLSGVFDEKMQRRYVAALCTEIQYVAKTHPGCIVSTIYVGGGTPSWLSEDLMDAIITTVKKCFKLDPLAEVSVECNPGTLSAEKLNVYRSIGINRLSIGLQSANDDELKELGRIHDYNRFLHTYDLVRKAGFENVNVDIMTGLPHQNLQKLEKTLSSVTMLRPEHISAYSLIIEKGTPFYEKYKFDAVKQQAGMETEDLPTDEESYKLYKYTMQYLESKGYKRYEISNYARNGKICRHNVGYWDRVPYLGLGLGSASLFDNVRTNNIRDIYKYCEISESIAQGKNLDYELSSPYLETEEIISKKEAMEEFMFLGLRKINGIARSDFYQIFDIDIEAIYGPIITALRNQGFMDAKEGRLFLTDIGIDVSNQVLSKFLLDK